MIPAARVLGWEWLNSFLPAVLKKISVIHYLQSLCPVPIDAGPFALPAEPTPAPLAIGRPAARRGAALSRRAAAPAGSKSPTPATEPIAGDPSRRRPTVATEIRFPARRGSSRLRRTSSPRW